MLLLLHCRQVSHGCDSLLSTWWLNVQGPLMQSAAEDSNDTGKAQQPHNQDVFQDGFTQAH
jgi:hypothetical protein